MLLLEALIVSLFTAVLMVWLFFVYKTIQEEKMEKKNKNQRGSTALAFGGLLIVVFFLGLIFAPYTIISAGDVGVVTTMGKVSNEPLMPGFHFISFIDAVKKIDAQIQKNEHVYQAASKDLQAVTVSMVLNYRILPTEAPGLYQKVGYEYFDRIVLPVASESLKAEIALHNATEILQERPAIKKSVEEHIQKDIERHGIKLEAVSLSNVSFSPEYEKAIETKQVQQQLAEQKQYELQQKKLDAEMVVTKARGDSDAKKLEADGMAYYNEKTAQALTDKLLQMKYYDKWDGQLPQYILGSNASMLMQMPGVKQ